MSHFKAKMHQIRFLMSVHLSVGWILTRSEILHKKNNSTCSLVAALQNCRLSVCVSFQRPLLVVLDRNMDLATPFHHTWTYQALAHDVLVS